MGDSTLGQSRPYIGWILKGPHTTGEGKRRSTLSAGRERERVDRVLSLRRQILLVIFHGVSCYGSLGNDNRGTSRVRRSVCGYLDCVETSSAQASSSLELSRAKGRGSAQRRGGTEGSVSRGEGSKAPASLCLLGG